MVMDKYFRPYINKNDREQNFGSERDWISDKHHIIPSSRNVNGRNWPTIELYQTLHRSYHRLFGNAVFQEALAQMLKINWPVLSNRYKRDIEEIMNMNNEYVYKDWIRIKK